MPSRLQLTAPDNKRVTLVFSTAYTLLLHSFAKSDNSSPFLSTVCALFTKTTGVYPLAATLSPSCHTFSNPLFSYSSKLLPPQLLRFDNHLNCLGVGVSLFSLLHYVTTSLFPSLL